MDETVDREAGGMGIIAMSGCATGIGAATRKRLEADGHEVIGIDLKGVEINADLSTREGRESAVSRTLEKCGGRLDRLVLCAGVGGHISDTAMVASVNYFGVVELLDGLLPALRKGEDPAAVVIASNSAQLDPNAAESTLVQAMLAGDEGEARRLAAEDYVGQQVYMLSKNAVGTAVRLRTSSWGEARVRLNPVETPLLQGGLDTPGIGDAIRDFQVPIGRWAQPAEMAELVSFLLGPNTAFVHGAIWYADGGSDAAMRPDRF